ncbi:MAG: DUF1926 domain-containing protein, partial [Spirochaetales bacterium]|nr:DUF1926 domain-containing protein [Spirochaetales bacterium]
FDKANRVQITLGADREFSLWSLPVHTTSYQSDKLQKVYQSSCFVQQWSLELDPGAQEELRVTMDLRKR